MIIEILVIKKIHRFDKVLLYKEFDICMVDNQYSSNISKLKQVYEKYRLIPWFFKIDTANNQYSSI